MKTEFRFIEDNGVFYTEKSSWNTMFKWKEVKNSRSTNKIVAQKFYWTIVNKKITQHNSKKTLHQN